MEDYDEDARLHCTAPEEYPGYPTRVTIIDRSDEAELEDGDMLESTDREIATIARIVSENKGQPVFDVKKQVERSVEYRDIVILSRNRHTIPAIEKALNDRGIPAFGENPGGYFESVEIEIFVNLLKVIDNIRQDIPLISVMHSPIFGFYWQRNWRRYALRSGRAASIRRSAVTRKHPWKYLCPGKSAKNAGAADLLETAAANGKPGRTAESIIV